MSAHLYIEGSGDSKELHARCREAFSKLLRKCGFQGRMPRLSACGGRASVMADFSIAHANSRPGHFVAMWIDSEEPIANIEKAWQHLGMEGWDRPQGANDDQVLFMTTCMETWIVTDRHTLAEHYGSQLQESALPSQVQLENRSRHDVQNALAHATRDCSNAYSKGERSFTVLAKLDPDVLAQHLPSFARVRRILNAKL